MLVVEVLECQDPEYEGVWRLHKNQLYLGYPEGDITPAVPGLPSYGFLIEVLPDMVQGTPHPEIVHWLLNGKRATRPRRLRIGDEITVANVRLKILEVELQEFESKKSILDARLQKLVESNSGLLPLIKILKDKTK